MVKYKAKVIEVYTVQGEIGETVESQIVLDVDGYKIEAFNLSLKVPEKGSTINVDVGLMCHDIEKINVPGKLIRQLQKFPNDSVYICIGEVVDIVEKVAGYPPEMGYRIVFNCGILLDVDWPKIKGNPKEKIKKGDWIFVKGRMDMEICEN